MKFSIMSFKQLLLVASVFLALVLPSCYGAADESKDSSTSTNNTMNRNKSFSLLLGEGEQVFDSSEGEIKVWSPLFNIALRQDNLFVSWVVLESRTITLPSFHSVAEAFYVVSGVGKLGLVHKGGSVEVDIHTGDVYGVTEGHVHYFVNAEYGQPLELFIVLKGVKRGPFEFDNFEPSFLVGGNHNNKGVLQAFGEDILSQAFKASRGDVRNVLFQQNQGPIIRLPDYFSPKRTFFQKLAKTTFGGLLNYFQGTGAPLPYNLPEESPHDVEKDIGWSTVAHREKSTTLGKVDLGAFAVSLHPGSLLVPHYNPLATEVSLVTRGKGRIQISHPNGTLALDAVVEKGDIFVVPQFHVVAQKASFSDGLEFVGFSTSASPKPPVFLAGAGNLLTSLNRPLLSAVFNAPEDLIDTFLGAQTEATIVGTYEQGIASRVEAINSNSE